VLYVVLNVSVSSIVVVGIITTAVISRYFSCWGV